LLADIKQIFDTREAEKLSGKELTNALLELEECPWPTWNKGKPFTQHQLARLLRNYGAISQTIRDGGLTFKGYYRHSFEDAFDRYLSSPSSSPPGSTRHVVTSSGKQAEKESFELVTKAQCDELRNAENARNSVACDGVTSSNGGKEQNEVQDDIEAQSNNAASWRGVRL
jgi:putative DNA primase/helicase